MREFQMALRETEQLTRMITAAALSPEALDKMSPVLLGKSSPVGLRDSAQDCRIFLLE
jgi:hypothetical protein